MKNCWKVTMQTNFILFGSCESDSTTKYFIRSWSTLHEGNFLCFITICWSTTLRKFEAVKVTHVFCDAREIPREVCCQAVCYLVQPSFPWRQSSVYGDSKRFTSISCQPHSQVGLREQNNLSSSKLCVSEGNNRFKQPHTRGLELIRSENW